MTGDSLPKDRPEETAAAEKKPKDATETALPDFIRPRMLTVSSTKIVREIGDKLRTAPPIKRPDKVAEAG